VVVGEVVRVREELIQISLSAGQGRLRRDPYPLVPSPTRTHALPGEGEPLLIVS
jgi:hypothetical protein